MLTYVKFWKFSKKIIFFRNFFFLKISFRLWNNGSIHFWVNYSWWSCFYIINWFRNVLKSKLRTFHKWGVKKKFIFITFMLKNMHKCFTECRDIKIGMSFSFLPQRFFFRLKISPRIHFCRCTLLDLFLSKIVSC